MNRRTMKKIIGLCCATFLLSGCHIYKSYDRPESIDATGIYRDPVAANDTLAANDTTNMGNLSWKEIFRDPKLQMLIEEGLAAVNKTENIFASGIKGAEEYSFKAMETMAGKLKSAADIKTENNNLSSKKMTESYKEYVNATCLFLNKETKTIGQSLHLPGYFLDFHYR